MLDRIEKDLNRELELNIRDLSVEEIYSWKHHPATKSFRVLIEQFLLEQYNRWESGQNSDMRNHHMAEGAAFTANVLLDCVDNLAKRLGLEIETVEVDEEEEIAYG